MVSKVCKMSQMSIEINSQRSLKSTRTGKGNARGDLYNSERLSNDIGTNPENTYELPIETGYYPDMYYYNGVPFPTRDNHDNPFLD